MENKIILSNFQIPIIKGLTYLTDNSESIESVVINAPRMQYSLYFEKNMENHDIENIDEYNLILIKKNNHKIYFFYPYKQNKIKTTLWYFKIEILDEEGKVNILPGQVLMDSSIINKQRNSIKLPFMNILENVKINKNISLT